MISWISSAASNSRIIGTRAAAAAVGPVDSAARIGAAALGSHHIGSLSTAARSTSTSTAAALNENLHNPQHYYQQPVYVHQVSKTVLEHLQLHCHDWIRQEGLEQGLRIHANGTFSLQYPALKTTNGAGGARFDTGRIW